MLSKTIFFAGMLAVAAILILPAVSLATSEAPPAYVLKLPNPLGCNNADGIACIATIIINALFAIAIPVTAIMVTWAGFLFLTSAGNAEKVTAAKNTILYAVIGFAVIILAGAVRGILQGFLFAPGP